MAEENQPVYKVKVNEFEFTFTQQQIDAADLIQTEPHHFHLLHQNKSVNALLQDADAASKQQVMEISGQRFDITIHDELDQMLDRLGFSVAAGKHIKEIKAPMPGLVLEVNVTEGQQVKEGDKILILVAMKMENSIMIHADATIKKINVQAGAAVEKGQVLVELD